MESLENVYISFIGIIGAGKTTLSQKLGTLLGIPVYLEEAQDKELMDKFYDDMKKYGFTLQIELLTSRYLQQQQISFSGKGAIQDRSIYEDQVFSRMLNKAGLLKDEDLQAYINLFNVVSKTMIHPTVLIYLDVTPEQALRRIKVRNRENEKGITLEYLQNLYESYVEFIDEISKIIPVIRVDWSEFEDEEKVALAIVGQLSKIKHIYTIKL